MIKIKFEVKEEEKEVTPLPIENENEQIKELLSLNCFDNNNSCLSTNLDNPEIETEKLRQKREYDRKRRQQLLASATPEQLEQRRLKHSEKVRRLREKETEEQRERRLEQKRQYDKTVAKQRREQKRLNLTKTIESIVSDNHPEVSLSLDLSALIQNLNSDETFNYSEIIRNSVDITADNGNSESTNDIGGCFHSDQDFGFGSISDVDPLSASSTSVAEKLRQKREYDRKRRQQLLANATPEQREQMRLKHSEKVRRLRKNESEEQRQRRLERRRKYDRTVAKQRMEQKLLNLTKTEPAESSLSLTTQLNHSFNNQTLLGQNRIQNGWTTNEQSIPIGTQQQQQQSLFVPKIELIVLDNQEVPLSLDQSFLSIPNSAETTTTNCDIITTEMFSAAGPRAGFGRRAKLNVCYSVPKEPEPVPRRQRNSVDNLGEIQEQIGDSA